MVGSAAVTFDRIYRGNLWKGTESLSGPGSGLAPTRHVAQWLSGLAYQYRVTSVLNVGCGDDLWTPDLPGYVGVDVSGTAIARARTLHPDRTYLRDDGSLRLPVGPWDLILIRDVIQHLSFRDGLRLLREVRHAGPRLLVASTYSGTSERYPADLVNRDIRTGDCYSPDLTRAPFDLPEPTLRTPDGFDYEAGLEVRDGAKWLALWVL